MSDSRIRDAHARLTRLLAQKRLFLGVNIGLMSRPGSPVFRRIESALPIGLGLFGVIGATIVGGVMLGILALTAGIAVWFLVILPRIKDQVYARTYAFVTSTPESFLRAWEETAITLKSGEDECRPPDGDWVAFVRAARTREEEEEDGYR
ncbi:hypothetical protein [Elioraea sp.]|uniref:hypothetical protein n=1 Tax=Elioraea sp. TaxID=2185103 RepID=UPI003F711D1F